MKIKKAIQFYLINFFFKKLKMVEGDNGAKFFIKKNLKDFLKLEVSDQGVIRDIDNAEQYYDFLNNEKAIKTYTLGFWRSSY